MFTNKLKRILAKNSYITLFLSVTLIVILSIGSPYFWTVDNLNSLQTSIAPTAIVSMGMLMLLIVGVFDLSVGAIMVLTGIIYAKLFELNLPTPVVILAGLLLGVLLGLINGWLVAILKINPLIATIGSLYVYQGFAMLLMAAYQLETKFPSDFISIGTGKLLGLYYMFWIMLIILVLSSLFLRYRQGGRRLYFTGGNLEAAKMMGFNTKKILISTYVVTGFLCSLAGLLSVARYENANRYLGEGMNITAIISCVIGGASLSGGKGKPIGAVLGVVCMSLISNLFNLFEMKSTWQNVVVGAILIIVVTLDGYLTIRKQKELGKI